MATLLDRPRKDDIIQLRTEADTKALLQEAAALRGQKLSEFILASAREQALATLLDQRLIRLDEAAHARFLALLDDPPPLAEPVRARLAKKPAWAE